MFCRVQTKIYHRGAEAQSFQVKPILWQAGGSIVGMTDARIVLSTVALHETGLKIARAVVAEHLAACVNITTAR